MIFTTHVDASVADALSPSSCFHLAECFENHAVSGKAGAKCNMYQRSKRDFRTHTARGRLKILLTARFPRYI